jgi:phospholipid transport system substrate-binding protein
MKKLLAAWMVIMLVAFAPGFTPGGAAWSADEEKLPDQTAREVTDKIIGLIKQNRDAYSKDYKKLYAMVNENLLPYFDFRKVAQQVLGPEWRRANDEQRKRFTEEFRDLLVRTYATALLKYTDEKIVYAPLKIAPGDRQTVVKSTIQRSGGAPPVAINYSFYKPEGSGWKIYDMAIEGPSVVTTYKGVYADRLHKQNLDQLIESLAQENKRAAAGGAVETPK